MLNGQKSAFKIKIIGLQEFLISQIECLPELITTRVQNESEQELKSENREFFFLIFRERARIREFIKIV